MQDLIKTYETKVSVYATPHYLPSGRQLGFVGAVWHGSANP
jgi:hypothetical protein